MAAKPPPPGFLRTVTVEIRLGGFLIYHTPGLRVFIDDRCELYGDNQLLADFHANNDDPTKIDQWAEQYGFDTALVVTGSLLDRYLHYAKDWEVIRETLAATLYQKRRT